MGRVKEIRNYINKEIMQLENKEKIPAALQHLYGVSLAATILAKKRGEDPELAAIAGMLHDIHAYKTGSYDDHAHKGSDMARDILEKLGLTTQEENEIICSAVYHHDDKLVIDNAFDELMKDADVIDHCLNDVSKAIKDKEKVRFEQLTEELL
ncbi:MAG: HD domain-containing protein [Anaerobutyricum sp.]|nr:HD domain-containing protein [Anaerobutyricum sp.]